MLKRLLIISIGVFLLFSRGYAAGGTVEGVDSTVWVSLDGDTAAVIVYDQPVAVADTSSSFSERKETLRGRISVSRKKQQKKPT